MDELQGKKVEPPRKKLRTNTAMGSKKVAATTNKNGDEASSDANKPDGDAPGLCTDDTKPGPTTSK